MTSRRPGAPTLSGISSGWNSGPRDVGYTASDAGSGIAAAELYVDGEAVPTTSVEHSCLRLPGGDYSHPIPCATATGGQFALNTRELDGRPALGDRHRHRRRREPGSDHAGVPRRQHAARPAGGGDGRRAATAGGGATTSRSPGRTRAPTASLRLRAPTTGSASPPQGPTDGTFVAGADPTSISSLHVPGDGEWPVYVWLQDEAGNAAPPNEPVAHLRLDTSAPSLAFSERIRREQPGRAESRDRGRDERRRRRPASRSDGREAPTGAPSTPGSRAAPSSPPSPTTGSRGVPTSSRPPPGMRPATVRPPRRVRMAGRWCWPCRCGPRPGSARRSPATPALPAAQSASATAAAHSCADRCGQPRVRCRARDCS